jgi:hypothetical protein
MPTGGNHGSKSWPQWLGSHCHLLPEEQNGKRMIISFSYHKPGEENFFECGVTCKRVEAAFNFCLGSGTGNISSVHIWLKKLEKDKRKGI